MLIVWGLSIATFAILPFQLLERNLSAKGAFVMALFMAAYLIGTLLVPTRQRVDMTDSPVRIDAKNAEVLLMFASGFATVLLTFDAATKNVFDLAASYDLRSSVANALLKGQVSNSTTFFQMAFLLYPAGYVYTAVYAIYARHLHVWKLVIFGFMPIALAAVVMGGRMSILYAALVAWIALRERAKLGHASPQMPKKSNPRNWIVRLVWFVALLILLYYFATIFMVRAATVGGSAAMFDVAEQRWGVGFRGPMSTAIFAIFGEDMTYLIFIFVWYLIQGVVISNYVLSDYDGPLNLGAYGVEVISALMRRLDSQRLAEGFDSVLSLGTYGFFPSAWGSLFIDFGFFSIILCTIWGAFTALCYRRIVVQHRMKWLLVGPFATIGVIFSIINTPMGFTNGFITHCWLLAAFMLLKRHQNNTALNSS